MRHYAAVPTQTFFRLRINTLLDGKILLFFHQKTARCCMSIFLHVSMRLPRLAPKRCDANSCSNDAFLKFLFTSLVNIICLISFALVGSFLSSIRVQTNNFQFMQAFNSSTFSRMSNCQLLPMRFYWLF